MPSPSNLREVLYRKEWRGQTVEVVDHDGLRSLFFEDTMVQSCMLLDHPLWLYLPYTRHMVATLLFHNTPQRILMIGLGGASLAKFFLHYFPHCSLDIVDFNPEMAHIAHHYFFLPTDPRLTLYHVDGDTFIKNKQDEHQNLYDIILVDAYDQQGMSRSIYAKDFIIHTQRLLSHSGVMSINTSRTQATLHQTLLAILHDTFPDQAFRLPVKTSNNEIMFICHPDNPQKNPEKWQPKNLRWINHPNLDFIDFQRRIIPLKKASTIMKYIAFILILLVALSVVTIQSWDMSQIPGELFRLQDERVPLLEKRIAALEQQQVRTAALFESKLSLSDQQHIQVESGSVLAKKGDATWKLTNLFSRLRQYRQPVTFKRAFSSMPKIMLGITLLETSENVRLSVHAEQIHTQGFTMVFETRSDSRLEEVKVEWLAFSET